MPIIKYNTNIGMETSVQKNDNIDLGEMVANSVKVEKIDTDLFIGKELWMPWGARGAFGGNVVAQALHAGFQTVPEDFFIHSLHCYFILAVTGDTPIFYKVDRIRDGRSYVTRSITGTQKGKAAFICSASFTKPDNDIHLDHQTEMPNGTDPENILDDVDMIQNRLERSDYPENIRKRLEKFRDGVQRRADEDLPLEIRETSEYTSEELAMGTFKPHLRDGRWFKARENPGEDLRIHACLIAYGSDLEFMNTPSKANGTTYRSDRLLMASSLDHSMWFHQPVRADQWILHDMHSPRTSGGRGVSFGRMYTLDGTLVCTTAQESVIRLSKAEQERRRKQAQSENEIKLKRGENNRL